jgi:DNA-directed RNA polymerase specialized sigma24 family protein
VGTETKTNTLVGGLNQSDADHTKHQDPDVELMLAFQAGDEQAFTTLYEKYRDRLVNYSRRFLIDRARGEEAAQDVFLKLYRARARYQPVSRFSTYLFRIATNHCLNVLQRHDQKLVDRGTELSERPGAVLQRTRIHRRS